MAGAEGWHDKRRKEKRVKDRDGWMKRRDASKRKRGNVRGILK